METLIPFQGFYHSIHSDVLDHALESALGDNGGDPYPGLIDRAWMDVNNWKDAHIYYAKAYTDALAQALDLETLEFKLVVSPKYYNFETDRIIGEIDISEVKKLKAAVPDQVLANLIKERFTSYDGFISHYPNNLDYWPSDLKDWDHNHVGTLLEAYILLEHDENAFEIDLIDSANLYEAAYDAIDQLENLDRLANIAYYLRQREDRKHA